jgi:hypothetical protein
MQFVEHTMLNINTEVNANGGSMMTNDVNIQELAVKRVDTLRKKHRDISIDYIVQHSPFGDWATILYAEYDFSLTGFDIIESNNSWRRPEAVEEYNALVDEGYCVVVYSPNEVKGELAMRIKDEGRQNIRLHSIDKLLPTVIAK